MSDYKKSNAASQLLKHAKQGPVLEFLFSQASNVEVASSGPALSAEVATSYYKKTVEKAVAVASNPETDPDVLVKFAKDKRVGVRQALLHNPSTPLEVGLELVKWSISRYDDMSFFPMLTRMELKDLRAALQYGAENRVTARGQHVYTGSKVIANTLASKPECVYTTPLYVVSGLMDEIAKRIHNGKLNLSLTKLIDKQSEHAASVNRNETFKASVVETLVNERLLLTEELARLWVEAGHEKDTNSSRLYWSHRVGTIDAHKPAMIVQDGALEILLASDNPEHLRGAALNGASESQLLQAVSRETVSTRAVLEIMGLRGDRNFSAEFEHDISLQLLKKWNVEASDKAKSQSISNSTHKVPTGQELHEYLTDGLTHTLDSKVHAKLAVLGGKGYMASLLSFAKRNGNTNKNLLTGEILRLWHELSPKGLRDQYHTGSVTYENWSTHFEHVLQIVSGQEGFDDVVLDIFDFELADTLGVGYYSGPAIEIIGPHLMQVFGTNDITVWQTFLTLVGNWEQGLSGLISTACELSGVEPRKPAEETVEVANTNQLTLL